MRPTSAGRGGLRDTRAPAGRGGGLGSQLPAQARMGQAGARHGRRRPPAQAPDIRVGAVATVPADGSRHTLALAVGGSQGPQTAEPEPKPEPESEREPWAAKPPAPG